MNPTLSRCRYESPCGVMHLIASPEALVSIWWPDHQSSDPYDADSVDGAAHPVLSDTATQLDEYFAGTRQDFDLPLAPTGTAFQLDAWQALRRIPYGETRSYAQQAALLGRPKAVRAVGAANGRNPIPIVVPCHRVIGSNGSLTGFAGGLDMKRWLLNHERRVAGPANDGRLDL